MSQMRKEISRFLVVGFSAFGSDLLIYLALINYISHSQAKAISFISASMLAFTLNKYWTFGKMARTYSQMAKFALLYMSTLGANVGVNKVSLVVFPGLVLFAFLAASGTSTVLNFIGQKWWVFK